MSLNRRESDDGLSSEKADQHSRASGLAEAPKLGGKPRVLLLAYAFPPRKTDEGIRAYKLAKWLTHEGWVVTVLTPHVCAWGMTGERADEFLEELSRQAIRCIRTPHRRQWLLKVDGEQRKSFVGWAVRVGRQIAIFLGIDPAAGWLIEAEKACRVLAPDDVDLVLASGPPFGSFELAKQTGEYLACPYGLDDGFVVLDDDLHEAGSSISSTCGFPAEESSPRTFLTSICAGLR